MHKDKATSLSVLMNSFFNLLNVRRLRFYKRRMIAGIVVLVFCYYFFIVRQRKPLSSSVVACKSNLAKIAIPNEKKRLDYLLPVGNDFKAVEDDFFYFISTLTTNCKNQQHMGPDGDGGWGVCLEGRYDVSHHCLVYSFGVSKDLSFEKDVLRVMGCEVHSFDPSLGLKPFQFAPRAFFHDFGIDNVDTMDVRTGWRMKKLSTIMQELGHSGRTIDYFKMDVEFSEWLVLHELISSKLIHSIRQLVMEVHTPEMDVLELEGDTCSRTTPEVLSFMFRTLVDLRNAGFSLFSARPNHRIRYLSLVSGHQRHCCHNLHFVNNKHPLNAF